MPDEERKTALALRQAELDDIAQDLKGRATKIWKKPASFALTLSGAAVALATGHPLAAALTVGAAVTGYQAAAKMDAGAYSYLFRTHDPLWAELNRDDDSLTLVAHVQCRVCEGRYDTAAHFKGDLAVLSLCQLRRHLTRRGVYII
jgi:hypothetical protein